MTPLREHLIADMRTQNLPKETQEVYISEVAKLARHCRKSPDLIAPDELAEFLDGRKNELPVPDYSVAYEAVKFFFTQTLGRAWGTAVKALTKGTDLKRRMVLDMRLRTWPQTLR